MSKELEFEVMIDGNYGWIGTCRRVEVVALEWKKWMNFAFFECLIVDAYQVRWVVICNWLWKDDFLMNNAF